MDPVLPLGSPWIAPCFAGVPLGVGGRGACASYRGSSTTAGHGARWRMGPNPPPPPVQTPKPAPKGNSRGFCRTVSIRIWFNNLRIPTPSLTRSETAQKFTADPNMPKRTWKLTPPPPYAAGVGVQTSAESPRVMASSQAQRKVRQQPEQRLWPCPGAMGGPPTSRLGLCSPAPPSRRLRGGHVGGQGAG